jgi:threonine dehydrogenase-like Zn-dependent dehydrogenase
MHAAGDARVEEVPDASIAAPTEAIVRVTHAAICGSDLWPYGSKPAASPPQRMDHEFIGVIEEIGTDVIGVRGGDLVLSPFLFEDNTSDFCRRGLTSSCRNGGQYGHAKDGGHGDAVRVPQGDGTLVKLDVEQSSPLCHRCWPYLTCWPGASSRDACSIEPSTSSRCPTVIGLWLTAKLSKSSSPSEPSATNRRIHHS